MPAFSDEEVRRYGRQVLLREVGGKGQARIREAALLLRGGAVAAVAAEYLRRAGVARVQVEEVEAGGEVLSGPDAFLAGSLLALEALKRIAAGGS